MPTNPDLAYLASLQNNPMGALSHLSQNFAQGPTLQPQTPTGQTPYAPGPSPSAGPNTSGVDSGLSGLTRALFGDQIYNQYKSQIAQYDTPAIRQQLATYFQSPEFGQQLGMAKETLSPFLGLAPDSYAFFDPSTYQRWYPSGGGGSPTNLPGGTATPTASPTPSPNPAPLANTSSAQPLSKIGPKAAKPNYSSSPYR